MTSNVSMDQKADKGWREKLGEAVVEIVNDYRAARDFNAFCHCYLRWLKEDCEGMETIHSFGAEVVRAEKVQEFESLTIEAEAQCVAYGHALHSITSRFDHLRVHIPIASVLKGRGQYERDFVQEGQD
jgi:hypothetical protein